MLDCMFMCTYGVVVMLELFKAEQNVFDEVRCISWHQEDAKSTKDGVLAPNTAFFYTKHWNLTKKWKC